MPASISPNIVTLLCANAAAEIEQAASASRVFFVISKVLLTCFRSDRIFLMGLLIDMNKPEPGESRFSDSRKEPRRATGIGGLREPADALRPVR
jgi:hypothetical protein